MARAKKSKYKKIHERLFQILERAPHRDWVSKIVDLFIIVLILLNVTFIILESVESIHAVYGELFHIFDVTSVIIFTIEYVLRMWVATADKKYRHPIKGRLRFAMTPLAIVDLVSILPFYLPLIFPFDLRFVKALRLFRLFRLFKVARYSHGLETLIKVIRSQREELVVTLIATFVLLAVSSTLVYNFENPVQPDVFSDIPSAMWWGVSTLTTVGYGDVVPVTGWGKFWGGLISLLGIGIFALPAGIIATGYADELEKGKRKKLVTCPHCQKKFAPHMERRKIDLPTVHRR